MAEAPIRRWLRTPGGQLQLIAITFALAGVLAAVAATQRPFFERYVREKYPAPVEATRGLAVRLESEAVGAEELRDLRPDQWTSLYQLWLQTGSAQTQWPRLPRMFADLRPDLAVERVGRTLVAGSAAQQSAAIHFATASGSAALVPALRLGLDRARRIKLGPVAELEQALAALESAPARQ